ncbi:toprim domain-containing protein [Rhodoplanes sp. SY1]|uniref:DUF7146 domain-containing protein n=1 Tax=Rhodoplanes sp. SY1 TaxID=3166646 RepID=UPI0038B47976
MPGPAADLARRLARDAEAVCRHYLSNGRRQGRYWVVGDVENTPGRSLYVRLHGSDGGKGAAGKWTDAATGEHGDLLDLIARNCRLTEVPDVLDEARRFLSLPRPAPAPPLPQTPAGSPESARRLFAMGRPIRGTLAEVYLRARGIGDLGDLPALRFHPRCFHRATENSPYETWPALLAAITDLDGTITGVHRTWLAHDGAGKAPLATPRRAMGHLLGSGVRFGDVADVLIAGEGIETMLSIRCALPHMPLIAALSANHLAAVILPPTIRHLYVAQDDDAAGRRAAQTLRDRAEEIGIATAVLSPTKNDFNVDLRLLGPIGFAASLRRQLMPEDTTRFAACRS